MPLTDIQRLRAEGMSEREFQTSVVNLAEALGWKVYHTHDSRRSQPGFPDLVMVHARHGVVFRELKTMKGKESPHQTEWLDALTLSGADADLWRPSQLFDGTIKTVLTGGAA